MSWITYFAGSREYSFESKLQLKDIPLIAVEENLNLEIKLDLKKRGDVYRKVHNISLSDDNGMVGYANNLSEIGNLKIIKK